MSNFPIYQPYQDVFVRPDIREYKPTNLLYKSCIYLTFVNGGRRKLGRIKLQLLSIRSKTVVSNKRNFKLKLTIQELKEILKEKNK